MSTPNTLSAATQDRKARLAQLKSLKRKAPDSTSTTDEGLQTELATTQAQEDQDVQRTYLSGRNYDPETRGPKLGFEAAPTDGKHTLEQQAAALALSSKKEAEQETKNEAPLDLFKLRPKKPNWDLKRELKKRMEVLDIRTDNAIARIVRERVEGKQKVSGAANGGDSQSGITGALGGGELVEAIRAREREEEADGRREKELLTDEG